MPRRPFSDPKHNADFGIPPAFSPSEVLTHLTRPQSLETLPATTSLERQLKRIVVHVQAHATEKRLSDIEGSLCVARQFYDVSVHNRISQQRIFGPKAHERSDSVEDLQKNMPIAQERGRQAFNFLKKQVLNDRKAEIDLDVDGWMYLTQGDPGKTFYRIYLAPKLPYVAGVFTELAQTIPATVGYQMKTISPVLDRPEEFGRGDKIVLYPTREDLPALLKAVERVYQRHPEVFEGQLPPGGGIYTPAEGVSITYDPPREGGKKSTGTVEIATVLEKALKERAQSQLELIVEKSFKDLAQFKNSTIGRLMWKALVFQGEWMQEPKVGRWTQDTNKRYADEPMTEDDQTLSRCYYEALYEEWILSLRDHRPMNNERVKQIFFPRMREAMVLHYAWEKRMQQKDAFETAISWPRGRPDIEQATRIAALAASVYKRQKSGEPMEEALAANLEGKTYQPRSREP